jgi:hypothetical protein
VVGTAVDVEQRSRLVVVVLVLPLLEVVLVLAWGSTWR